MVKDALKDILKKSLTVRRFFRRYRSKVGGYPEWEKLLAKDRLLWEKSLAKAKEGPKTLIATSVGLLLPGVIVESLLGVALTLRGRDVHILLCDEFLPACLACEVSWYPKQEKFVEYGPSKDLCKDCFKPAEKMYSSLGFKVHRYGELVTDEEQKTAEKISSGIPVAEIGGYKFNGMAVGEHALAGTLRFYAKASLESEPRGEEALRRYFKASMLTVFATQRLLKKYTFESAVFLHGIYVPQGLTGEVCRKQGVRVVNWNPAYRKKCFIFSHNDTYHHTLMTEPAGKWESMTWTPEMEADIMRYLESRWYGKEDWILFHDRPNVKMDDIAKEIGADFSKPCVGMLTNVMWDAQLHYPANAFPNMLEWVLQTISYFAKRPELNLIIRVHPAEVRGVQPSRQPITDEIKKAFPRIPANVFIIPPESRISTYAAMLRCDSAIIYGTKTGVELTSVGLPVIVAGEAWIRNKGVTMDAVSAADYFKMLDKLPLREKLDDATRKRARMYAYHFFFRRMIPVKVIEPVSMHPSLRVNFGRLSELDRGGDAGLDVICDGITKGEDFIYPAERFRNYGQEERKQ